MPDPGVLLVDDESLALKYFAKAFAGKFRVFSAHSAAAALSTLAEHGDEIAVIVTDQRMPEATGVELLREVRQRYPRIIRILTTAYADLDVLVQAINTGAVFSFVAKPWQLGDLERTLTQALARHESESAAHHLLATKLEEFRATLLEGRTYDLAQIAARIGHYVHNALCPVHVLIEQLGEHPAPPPPSPAFLRDVGAQVQAISRTLKDLAQISTPPPRRLFRPVHLAPIAAIALAGLELLRAEKHLRFDVTIADDTPAIHGDPAQIETLFRFMLTEETVSLPVGSTIRLRLSRETTEAHSGWARIEFEDDEPLSPTFHPDDLLQPFRPRGSNPRDFGIFLACSYLIAQHHDGRLDLCIKENGGLLFTFLLPTSPSPLVETTGKTNTRDLGMG